MLRFCEKRFLVDVKPNICYWRPGRGDRMVETLRCSKWHGDGFAGPGGHSANLKAWRSV